MKQKENKFKQCNSMAFGFDLPSGENTYNILKHFNAGFKVNRTHEEYSSDIERIQNNLL